MRTVITLLLSVYLALGQSAAGRLGTGLPQGSAGGVGTCGITSGSVAYIGSFRFPTDYASHGSAIGFQFHGAGGGTSNGAAFDAAGNGGLGSLYINSSPVDVFGANVAELKIPGTGANTCQAGGACDLVAGNNPTGGSTNVTSLPVAAWIQDFVDITNGAGYFTSQWKMGGFAVSGSNLYGTGFYYFGPGQNVTMWRKGKTLATADFFGFETLYDGTFATDTTLDQALGSIAGPVGEIPPALQASLGGSLMAGQFGLSIVSRNSFGPSAFAFSPSSIGLDTPSANPLVASSSPVTTAKALVSYPSNHETLGQWDDNALGGPINHFKEDPSTRPWVSWIEQLATPVIEDNCFMSVTQYGVGHAVSGSSGLDVVTAHYGPTTLDWAKNETYTGLDYNGVAYSGGTEISLANANRLNSVAGTKIVTSDGTPFSAGASAAGKVLYITGGTHFVPQNYVIDTFNSTSSVTLLVDPTDGTNATGGTGNTGADVGVFSYDPTKPDFSGHSPYGWPYHYRIILYNITDLQEVAAGLKKPWEIFPTRKFDIPMPFDPRDRSPVEVVYDRGRRNLILIQPYSQDQDPTMAFPMAHVYHISP